MVSGLVLFVPRLVSAGPNVTPPPGVEVTLSILDVWLRNISSFLLTVGVILAVIFIVWGGIMYMAAGGDTEKATTAKTRIWNGIIGAIIVLGVGLILNTISRLVTSGVIY